MVECSFTTKWLWVWVQLQLLMYCKTFYLLEQTMIFIIIISWCEHLCKLRRISFKLPSGKTKVKGKIYISHYQSRTWYSFIAEKTGRWPWNKLQNNKAKYLGNKGTSLYYRKLKIKSWFLNYEFMYIFSIIVSLLFIPTLRCIIYPKNWNLLKEYISYYYYWNSFVEKCTCSIG